MSIWRYRRSIAHPEWILDALGTLSRTASLYSKGIIPGAIEAPMIVVPVKRVLRGVYGSDLRAALALLLMALRGLPGHWSYSVNSFWQFTILRKNRQAYYDEKMAELAHGDDE